MNENTFQTTSLVGIGYANYNLAQQRQTLADLSQQIRSQQLKQEEVKRLRDWVFQANKAIEELIANSVLNPAAAYYHAAQIKPLLMTGSLSAESFSEFKDKEYYHATCKKLDLLENECSRLLGDNSVLEIRKYIWFEQIKDEVRELVELQVKRDELEAVQQAIKPYKKRWAFYIDGRMTMKVLAIVFSLVCFFAVLPMVGDDATLSGFLFIVGGPVVPLCLYFAYLKGRDRFIRKITSIIRRYIDEIDRYPNFVVIRIGELRAKITDARRRLLNKEFNPDNYPTTQQLQTAYRTIMLEMKQIENKFSHASTSAP